MRVVLDTNVLIAAFIAHGVCNELLEHCALDHEIVLSPFILGELKGKLVKKFRFTAREAHEAVCLLESRVTMVTPSPLDQPVCRDRDDDNIIATAVAASCDCVVTGDRDLLDLETVRGIPIIPPATFWKWKTGKSNKTIAAIP